MGVQEKENEGEALTVKGNGRDRGRRASLPEAHIQPDALVAVQSALMAQVSSAGEEVQENEGEAIEVKGNRRERRRRASLPEAHIQPDALVAVQSALMAQVSSAGEEVQENEGEAI